MSSTRTGSDFVQDYTPAHLAKLFPIGQCRARHGHDLQPPLARSSYYHNATRVGYWDGLSTTQVQQQTVMPWPAPDPPLRGLRKMLARGYVELCLAEI
eukprot:1427450-Heterocapsa_arctica.AAC.1